MSLLLAAGSAPPSSDAELLALLAWDFQEIDDFDYWNSPALQPDDAASDAELLQLAPQAGEDADDFDYWRLDAFQPADELAPDAELLQAFQPAFDDADDFDYWQQSAFQFDDAAQSDAELLAIAAFSGEELDEYDYPPPQSVAEFEQPSDDPETRFSVAFDGDESGDEFDYGIDSFQPDIPAIADVGGYDPGDKPRRKSPHKGFDLEQWRRNRGAFDAGLESTIDRLWQDITGTAPQAVSEQAAQAVAAYVKTEAPQHERHFQVDWSRALHDRAAIEAFIAIHERWKREQDDIEFLLLNG